MSNENVPGSSGSIEGRERGREGEGQGGRTENMVSIVSIF